MDVFITYEKDGYGGQQVKKVFAKKQDAIEHIINNVFGSNHFYANQTRAENEKCAIEHIEDHYVEGI